MNRSRTTTLLVAVCFLTVICILLGSRPPGPAVPATLRVPLVGQAMSQLCWAATTEMVTSYYHNLDPRNQFISQCELVKKANPSVMIDCAHVGRRDSVVNEPGNPFANVNTYCTSDWNGGGTIPYDTLASEFAAGRPVIFQWAYYGVTTNMKSSMTKAMNLDYPIGAHFLVAEGLPHSEHSDSLWVSINDPLPVGQGTHKVISYSAFCGEVPVSRRKAGQTYDPTTIFDMNMGATYKIEPIRQKK